MKKVLITGAGGAGIYPIWKILKKKYKMYFADMEPELINPKLPNILKIKIQSANNKFYIRDLIRIIKKYKIDLVIPTVDEEIIKIVNYKEILKISYIPNKEFIKRTMDKYVLYTELQKVNLAAPLTYLANEKKIPFPKNYIIKPRYGRGSKNIFFISKKNHIISYLKLHEFLPKNVVIQEKLNGKEYSVYVGMNNKQKIIKILPVKILKKKGITISGKIENNKKIEIYLKKFIKCFPTNNSFNIQLFLTKKGIFPFEINPRISTTFFLSLLDGYDPFSEKKLKFKSVSSAMKNKYLLRYWSNFIH